MKFRKKEFSFFIAGISLAVSCLFNYFHPTTGQVKPALSSYYNVIKVYDGDTIKLSDGRKVRFIGIDTPELHLSQKLYRDAQRTGEDVKTIQIMGKEAKDFTENLLLGKQVRLEFDARTEDKYGRLLAYVYTSDGQMANAKIIEEGYASLMTIPPNIRYAEDFKKLYVQAKEAKKGLWALNKEAAFVLSNR